MSFECRTVQKGDDELRIRIILTRNASQFLVGESVNLVEELLLRPIRILMLPGELVAQAMSVVIVSRELSEGRNSLRPAS